MNAIETLLKDLLQPDPPSSPSDPRSSRRPLLVDHFTWKIPSPDATPYKNIYHGGEENEKREIFYKHICIEGPPFLGELKLELNWHYWCIRKDNEFIVDQIRCSLISTRANTLVLPAEAPVSQSFSYPEQSFGPVVIPIKGFNDVLPFVSVPLRDVTVRLSGQSISTTYTFALAFEYAKRLKRQEQPDSFRALFGTEEISCSIGGRPRPVEQLRRAVRRAFWEEVVGEGPREVKHVTGEIGDPLRVLADGAEFVVSKEKLAQASPVFAACFNHPDTLEGQSDSYTIPNFTAPVVERFLHFCTTGTLRDPEQHALELLHLAHQYQSPALLEHCQLALLHAVLGGCPVDTLAKVAGAAVRLVLPGLLGAVHLVVEEASPGWKKEEWLRWGRFVEETPGFAVERCRLLAEMSEI